MRAIIVLLLCVCLTFASACAYENNKNDVSAHIDESANQHDIVDNTSEANMDLQKSIEQIYKLDDISIEYPQFTGNNEIELDKLNNMIKNYALSILDKYDNAEDFSLDIVSEVKYCDDNFVSIVFSGYSYIIDYPYPNNEFYTINIDISKMKELKLSDFVSVNKNFAELLKSDMFNVVNLEQVELLNEYTIEQLLECLNDADIGSSMSKAFSYYTDSKIGISITVLHVLGDHAEFEANYQDIKSFKRTITPSHEFTKEEAVQLVADEYYNGKISELQVEELSNNKYLVRLVYDMGTGLISTANAHLVVNGQIIASLINENGITDNSFYQKVDEHRE